MSIRFTSAASPSAPAKAEKQKQVEAPKTAAKAVRNVTKPLGRKPSGNAKKLLTLRLDPDVVEFYRSIGEGWQTRINEILRKNAGL